ncbi:putative RNA-directed DNA polymerase from transposon X-element [Trichonephila clavipes]|nr:putative RNA-directed DNA polymerase from transposon X-element [Trichonephila clavipes]
MLSSRPGAIYQQDNARPHTVATLQQCLQGYDVLPWPARTPDLSPIEHVWALGRQLQPGAKLVAPQTATHLQPRQRSGSIIDLAVFKHIPFNYSIRVLNDLSSDHYPVILEINLNTSIIKNPEQLSTNWNNFKFALNKKPIPTLDLTSNENIELAISELNQNFSEAFVEASKPKFKNTPKILSPEIKSTIHQRNRLRKFWQRTRCPSIYSEFRTLSREIAKDIKTHSRTQWEKHIEALSPVDNTL